MEKISVIMSTYKEPVEWVAKCIESVVKQTITPFEYIIIVDYPDNTEMINMLKEYEEKYSFIKIVINEENMGLVKSLNRALEHCHGDYIARIDADDYACLDRFEKQLNYLKQKDYDIVGAGYTVFFDNQIIAKRFGKTNDVLCKKLLNYCDCVAHPTWFVKKGVYQSLNGYRNIDACEDLDFLIRAAQAGYKMGCVAEQLMWYRDNPNSISHKKNYKQQVVKNYLCRMYREKHSVSIEEYNDYISGESFKKNVRLLEKLDDSKSGEYNKKDFCSKVKKLFFNISNEAYRKQTVINQKVKLINKIYG